MADQTDALGKLIELIKDVKIAMLTTVIPDGSLHSRPMVAQQPEPDGTLWFITGKSTSKVQEIKHDQHVNVAFADLADNKFVSISGRASVIDDRSKEEQLWNPAYRAWFPNGLDDPDLTLIKVDMDGAEYWDSSSSAMVQLAGLAKALVTGERYEPDEHGVVST